MPLAWLHPFAVEGDLRAMGSGNPSKSHMGGMGVGALTFTHPSLNPSFFFHTLLPQIQLKTCKNLSLPPSFFFVHLSSQFSFFLSLSFYSSSLSHSHTHIFQVFSVLELKHQSFLLFRDKHFLKVGLLPPSSYFRVCFLHVIVFGI